MIEHYGVTGDDSLNTEELAGADETALTKVIARLPKYGPIFTDFNQGAKERTWYACVIVSYLRSWFSIFNPKENFEEILLDLCDEFEKLGVWDPKSGGKVSEIGDAFVIYMNRRFPDRKIWKTRIKYGSSVMSGCITRNIPVITAYINGNTYNSARSDGVIEESEINSIKKEGYGHCITVTSLGPLWAYLGFQDNYEGRKDNQYKIYGFKYLRMKTWFENCFFVILPVNAVPVPENMRHKVIL